MFKMQHRSSFLFVLPLVLFAGCHKAPDAGVMASVNGHPILATDVEKAYNAQLANNPQQRPQSQDQADSWRLNILVQMITDNIVDQAATKMGLTATDAEVDAKLAELKAPYTEDQFQAKLKANNQTLDEVRHIIHLDLTKTKLLNKEINSKITVTDADVSTYYNAHKADWNYIEPRYHLAQIQVTNQPAQQAGNLQGSKATNDDEARKKIQALKTQLDSGADFGTVAANYSERADTAPNGGDMGFISDSEMKGDPSTYAAIMKLKAGEITDILPLLDYQTHKAVGYSIYKLIGKEPAGQRDLNNPAVQQSIRTQLQNSRSQLLQGAYLEMLRDQAKIENYFAEQIFKNSAK